MNILKNYLMGFVGDLGSYYYWAVQNITDYGQFVSDPILKY